MTTAIHFEVKKHAVRQTADGWVVSFVVHPNDMDSAFAVSPLGTRYILAVAQIGDDEQLVSPAGTDPQTRKEVAAVTSPGKDTRQTPVGEPKSPSERAVIRAALLPKDERFRSWVAGRHDCPVTAGEMVSADEAVAYIRFHCCNRHSRGTIAEVPEYLDRFLSMETEFKIDVGEIARPR